MAHEYDWLKSKIENLIELAKPLKGIHPSVFYEAGPWSITKLLAILRFVHIYTSIIKAPRQSRIFQNMYYIDMLAGSGLCRIGSKGDVIAGSAVVACKHCFHPFDKYFFVENNPERAKALNARIKTITSDFKLFRCDCNTCIEDIMAEMDERSHYLAFVDCEGLDVSWSTMKTLFAKNGDVLFNFQTSEISRLPTKVKNRSKGWQATEERLNWFFGDDGWRDCKEQDDFLERYIDKIRRETTREVVLPLPVKGEKSFRYDIILATRKTQGGNPWMVPMEQLRRRMGGYRPKIVEKTLDILTKRQLSLTDSFA